MLADCLCEGMLYKDRGKMKRLIQRRQGEVKAVYREKELIDHLVVMSTQLKEHMEGMLDRRRHLVVLAALVQKL